VTDINTPIDALHAECITAKFSIRREVEAKRASVSTWEPRPMPANYTIDHRLDQPTARRET